MPDKELGSTGLKQWGGVIQEEFLRELRGVDGVKRFNEMRNNSPIVAALLLAIEHGIRGVNWSFESDMGAEDPRIEFLDDALLQFSWGDHVSEALGMLWAGWSIFEIVYKRQGNQIMWDKLAVRGQDTLSYWDMDDNGTLKGFVQQAAPTYLLVKIPIEKCVLYRTRVEKGNPEGRSILRPAWISYYYMKNIAQIEAIGVERDLAGMPVIHLPEGATTNESDSNSDASKAAKVVRNIRRDEQEGLVLPPGWTFELASTGGSRQFDTDKIISRYENRILMSCLAQFLMLGAQGVGSLALSRDQTDLFTMSVNATADIIAETFTRAAVKRLLELNGLDSAGIKMVHTPAGDVDITSIADFLQKINPLLTWTVQDEAWLRSLAKLPEIDAEELQAERDRKDAISQTIAESTQAKAQVETKDENAPEETPKDGVPEDESTDEESQMGMNVKALDLFASGGYDGGDAERRLYERRFQKLWQRYLQASKTRVIKGAKGMRR